MGQVSIYRIPFEGFFLTLGTALFPIYVFPSGGIQPSHMLFFVFSVIVLFLRGVPNTLVPLLLFIVFLHVFFVEAFYTFGGADPRNLIHAAFYLFNFLFGSAVYLHCRRNGLISVKYGIIVAATIAMASVAMGGVNLESIEGTGRNSGAFNNPNQLGFFSVCLLSIFFLLHRLNYMTFQVYILTLPVPIFLSIVSLSKAAMISNFIVILLAVSPRLSLKTLAFWLAGLSGGGISFSKRLRRARLVNFFFSTGLPTLRMRMIHLLKYEATSPFWMGVPFRFFWGLALKES